MLNVQMNETLARKGIVHFYMNHNSQITERKIQVLKGKVKGIDGLENPVIYEIKANDSQADMMSMGFSYYEVTIYTYDQIKGSGKNKVLGPDGKMKTVKDSKEYRRIKLRNFRNALNALHFVYNEMNGKRTGRRKDYVRQSIKRYQGAKLGEALPNKRLPIFDDDLEAKPVNRIKNKILKLQLERKGKVYDWFSLDHRSIIKRTIAQ